MCEYCKESVVSSCGAEENFAHSRVQEGFDEPCYSDRPDSRQDSKRISRRLLLRELAIGAMAGLSFSVVTEAAGINDKARHAIEYLYDRFEQIDPNDSVEMTLGVVAIYGLAIDPDSCDGDGADNRRRWGREHIANTVQDNVSQIEQTLGGQYQIDIKHIEKVVEPEGVRPRRDDSDEVPMYTIDQFERYAKEAREQITESDDYNGKPVITMVIFDSHYSELSEKAIGIAYQDPDNPRTHISTYGAWKGCAPAHEIGHLLNPETIGEGMQHEGTFSARVKNEESGKLVQLYAIDTIQNLLKQGCALETNEYASYHTVMGSGHLDSSYSINEKDELRKDSHINRPIYSPPEIHFLQPWRKTTDATKQLGVHFLSYEKDKTFGLTTELPSNHALRKAIPYADSLFIGPNVDGFVANDKTTLEGLFVTDSIGVYAVSKDGRRTAEINTACFGMSNLENGDEYVVYADEQLNILVLSGKNDSGVYAKILELNTDEAQILLNEDREKTAERNKLIVDNYDKQLDKQSAIGTGAVGQISTLP